MKPVIIIAIAVILLIPLTVYAERNCEYDFVCVQTGDYLRFSTQVGETLLEFEDEITKDKINLKWTSFEQDGSIDYERLYVLDRSTGNYASSIDLDDTEFDYEFPFLFIQKIPLVETPENQEFCNNTQFNFDGKNRDVRSCPNEPEDSEIGIIVDIKTGILFRFNLDMEIINIKLELLETNIFSTQDFTETKLQTIIPEPSSKGGGCLIATATFGSELAPQVQQLRELRDNQLLNTESGTSFINTFNDFYYSFSPYIADLERENPVFKEMVKIVITPMISSLSILNYVDMDSEVEVLGYGISLILLNVGMYFVVPMVVIMRIRK